MVRKQSILMMTIAIFCLAFSACTGNASTAAGTATPLAVTPVKASSSTVAEASVVPIQSANLNFNTTGIVKEILKAEGSSVTKDEPIARLEGQERLEAALTSAKLALVSAQQSVNKLKDNGIANKAAAELKVANADKALKDAKKDLKNAANTRGTQDEIDEARAAYIVAQKAFDDIHDTYDTLAGMSDDSTTKAYALAGVGQARTTRDKALSDLNYLLAKPDVYDLAIAQSKADVAQANLDEAKTELDKLNDDGIDKNDWAVAQANLDNATAQVSAAQSSLDDLTLKAPFDGTVIANNLKVGEAVSLSATSTQVVLAGNSDWKIETTDLTELNINSIHEGDPVKITYDAVPGLESTGTVDSIQSLGQNKQGDITYKVTIKLDKQDARLRWNMTALVSFANKKP